MKGKREYKESNSKQHPRDKDMKKMEVNEDDFLCNRKRKPKEYEDGRWKRRWFMWEDGVQRWKRMDYDWCITDIYQDVRNNIMTNGVKEFAEKRFLSDGDHGEGKRKRPYLNDVKKEY